MALCKQCHGTGKFLYQTTAKWKPEIGGRAMTWGECSLCWGSGDELSPGPNLLDEWITEKGIDTRELRRERYKGTS